jgi:DNA-directed RNA polymerase specialized sigma24 family protein
MASQEEALLRRFVAARDAGDVAGARRWWEELVTLEYDRVAGMVAAWRGGRELRPDERDEATQVALLKLWRNMIRTFTGTTMGEWVNATLACVDFACRDVQRRAARQSARLKSLDQPASASGGDDDVRGAYDRALEAEGRRRDQRAREARDAEEFVTWALPQVADERRRLVLRMTLEGVPAEDIRRELDVSRDNLYQLRSRGLKDLAKLKERYDA